MEQPLQCRQDVEPIRKRKRKRRRRCKRHPQEGPHSPTCRGHQTTSATNGPALVRILPRLKPVLDYLDVKGDVFTREQIMGHLTEYIKKKALYDPADPRKVYCHNDPLGEIFKCEEFSTANACELLLENLEDISPRKNISEANSSKRTRSTFPCPPTPLTSVSTTDTCSCSESDQQSTSSELPCSSRSLLPLPCGVKRSYETAFPGTSSMIELSVSSVSRAETEDSILLTEFSKYYRGICEDATDVVTDTSDDLFFLNETDEERVVRQAPDSTDDENIVRQVYSEDEFAVEYEPISYSDEERLVATHGFDREAEGDSGDTEVDEGEDGGDELGNSDSSDSEIEEEDKWKCDLCPERNHPMTRRCIRCWAVRRDWFPPSLSRTSSDPGRIRHEITQVDQGTVSDSASTSQAHIIAPVINEACSSTTSESKDVYGGLKCILCRKEPPNGCIVHGRTGHQVCCVVCAQKLKDNNKACPVCRKKIGKVIKNFM